MKILDRDIAPGAAPFVIAEIGVNHDGSLKRALDLVQIAAGSGADAVKLQIFHADVLMHASTDMASYQQQQCDDASAVAMLRRYELSEDEITTVVEAIRAADMVPIATPFSPHDINIIEALDLPAIKIASPDAVNWPLLREASHLHRPMLISVGAATLDEIATTVNWLSGWNASAALLHCISSYPTSPDQANLCWIAELAEMFDLPVGYSDHTTEELSGALAVAAGATVVEKHLTYDRTASGPDHAASADPTQFASYVRQIRLAHCMLGQSGKHVLDIEADVRRVSRQSLVSKRPLSPGQVIREEDLTIQRPGTGIPAAMFEQITGRATNQSVPEGAILQWNMLANAA